MRVPILGGPHDGAAILIPKHQVAHGVAVKFGSTHYLIEWQKGRSPRLTYAGGTRAE